MKVIGLESLPQRSSSLSDAYVLSATATISRSGYQRLTNLRTKKLPGPLGEALVPLGGLPCVALGRS